MCKKKARDKIVEILFQVTMDTSFGDGLERDMVMDGFEFKGLNNMTDAELIKELESFGLCARCGEEHGS